MSTIDNAPDEQVIDSVRPLLLAKDLGAKTLGDFRQHMRLSGHSIDHWPEFARTGADTEHLTKAGLAMLLLAEFDRARATLVGQSPQPSPEKPFHAAGAWFPTNVLGSPMREFLPGKWETAVWPSSDTSQVVHTTVPAQFVVDKIEDWKGAWRRVPPFASRVNRGTRDAILRSHNPLFDLLINAQGVLRGQPK